MQSLQKHSLTLVVPLLTAAATFIASLALLWLASTSSDYLQAQRERSYGESIAAQIADAVSESLQRGDLLSARASLQRFTAVDMVGRIEIRDVEGMPMAAAGNTPATGAEEYRAAIRIGGDEAGEVLLTVDDRVAREGRFRFLFSLLALSAALSLLVFMGARALTQRHTQRIDQLRETLTLPETDTQTSTTNELTRLEHTVEQLPLELLRGRAEVPPAATEFQAGALLFVHLASLVRYVDTLSESNLHRYSRRLQQLLQAAAHCYRGELAVSRPFGLSISFSAESNAGDEALRAASCARLISRIITGLEERTSLSLGMTMAIGACEEAARESDDIYPALYQQGAIDELRELCLREATLGTRVDARLLKDTQLSQVAELSPGEADEEFVRLQSLTPELEKLIDHQAAIIVERIKPAS